MSMGVYPKWQTEMKLTDILLLYPEYDSVLGPYPRKDGRKHIVLNNTNVKNNTKGKTKTISYPKAMLEIKLGRRLKDNETADHKDEDLTNNKIDNLQVLTRRDNIKKSFALGNASPTAMVKFSKSIAGRAFRSRASQGQNNANAKFTDEQAEKLRFDVFHKKITIKDICKEYSVGIRSVENLLQGVTYSHLDNSYVCSIIKRKIGRPKNCESKKQKQIPIPDIPNAIQEKIIKYARLGFSSKAISKRLGINQQNVRKICKAS